MARILGLFPAALIAAKGGLSANAFYREQQQLGFGARRSEVLQLFKIAKSVTTASASEPFEDVTRAPNASTLAAWPTKSATGIRQNVTLTYRDRTTGHIKQTFYSTLNDQPISREAAISQAIDAYSEHAESYGQDLIGAVHTSAYNLVPGLAG